ncbi:MULTISPECIES: ATP-dependent zinc metalloprotease FtsH [unclassified Oceanispirochaeta]|uniref:ATP-dependent zinc metalloprotease FtsH n=1 Tax=unclassified Oceanispirochaeta TaxID=2635722 RepID=UPI000E095B01|nr:MULTISPECIES: ATP-dependent zinc metalloprotease FtsH [unclassified Oceanispirochaeta]MBF9018104.1 ATP-dependent zinc metalloprotease FtsH [Oceanispirochaeta sp. M2]NPD74568.1 ATP-dependent zinc metalloprotease FtsH [Oceanispirochaeta sp. M1]RDG29598.1 ATP-dependent zinc metalloprotease FtsH [Oceanispirochaeta sp. M1]
MPQDDNGNKNNNDNFNFNNNRSALMFLGILILFFMFFFSFSTQGEMNEIPYSMFLEYVNKGMIYDVQILDQKEIEGRYINPSDNQRSGMSFKTVIPYYDDNLMGLLIDKGVSIKGGDKTISPAIIMLQLLPWAISFLFIWWMFRSMQGGGGNKAFSFGKSKAKRYDHGKDSITFDDVAGQDESKFELMEVVDFLKHPEKFTKIGAKIPKGVLLVGNPGTGKTLLAKAVAGEAEVPFFHMSGSDFVEMFVGVGASRVRDLFEQGRKNAPCILFIDEIDAVGRTRGAGYGGGHDEREQTLNQLLVEMDGFNTEQAVIIIAATNRPDVLDPALLRAGRFDRQVVVDMPDVKEREAIIGIHCKKINLSPDVDLSVIARATPGSSGANLASIVNEAALFAARRAALVVEHQDFEEARDKVMMGVARKSRVLTHHEREMTAYHEAGHTLLHYYLENADPIHKVTIIPRGRALGVTFSLPENDNYSRSRSWIEDRICICYGGYVAEEVTYNVTTTGAKNDIDQATDMARKMVCDWGMSSKVGPISLGSGEEPIFIGKEIAQHKDYSDDTASLIDSEIRRILNDNLGKARNIIDEHRDQLESITRTLLVEETLDDKSIRNLLGPEFKKSDS